MDSQADQHEGKLMGFNNLSLRRKLLLVTTAATLVALFLASVGFLSYDRLAFRRVLAGDLATQASILASNSTAAMTFHDTQAATEVLSALRVQSGITAAALYENNGRPFASY